MPPLIGQQLGNLRVTALLGKGGMGEVYRARDLTLGREVAIKILPAEFANDSERIARLEREAEVLASLRHPNIAGIHSVGETNGSKFLVLELVEGDTLADRLARTALRPEESLRIAKFICSALETAHRQGIVHRDLKPSNVKIAPDGTVKVLDFGLAKPTNQPAPITSQSPTLLDSLLRHPGSILGTAGYMSPEQAKGLPVDLRTDVFSLGCVLFEMLTRKPAFPGETITEVLAATLTASPDLTLLPVELDPRLRPLLERMLAKNRDERWHSIADARLEIEAILKGPLLGQAPADASTRLLRRNPWLVGSLGVVLGASLLAVLNPRLWSGDRVAVPHLQFEIQHPATGGENQFDLSPDSRRLATVTGALGNQAIWVRYLDQGVDSILGGTTQANDPFWSPDGRFLGFFAERKLQRLDILGGSPRVLSDAVPYGGSWGSSGTILFSRGVGPLFRIPATGGVAVPATVLDTARGEREHVLPTFLPDGKRFLYLARCRVADSSAIVLGSLDSKKRKILMMSSLAARFGPPRHLLFVRGGTLMAQEVNPSTFEFRGEPVPLLQSVSSNIINGRVGVSSARNDVLAYRHSVYQDNSLYWYERPAAQLVPIPDLRGLELGTISPDGASFAAVRASASTAGDIWILNPSKGEELRLTSNEARDSDPVWSRDGSALVFDSRREGGVSNLYVKDVRGARPEELIVSSPNDKWPNDWSADGREIVFTEEDPKLLSDIWIFDRQQGKSIPYLQTPFSEANGRLSPDGRWMAYDSNESGVREVYVQAVPRTGARWKLSNGGGSEPRWSAEGNTLYYIHGIEGVMAVAVVRAGKSGEPRFGDSRLVMRAAVASFDVTPDGHRLLVDLIESHSASRLNILMGWRSQLSPRSGR